MNVDAIARRIALLEGMAQARPEQVARVRRLYWLALSVMPLDDTGAFAAECRRRADIAAPMDYFHLPITPQPQTTVQ